ncbi:MAG: flagellar biosynthesis repressor FlbT [Parvularculaceae bacterium]
MAGLILKLRPHEEFLINGVVVQNGDRKTRLRVKTDGAAILRLRDAMKPEEATTADRRAYYVAQLAVSGEISGEEASIILRGALETLRADYAGRPEIEAIQRAAEELEAGRFYGVMRRLGEFVRPKPAPPAATGAAAQN